MGQSKLKNEYHQSEKNNFVVMYNNISNEQKVGIQQLENVTNLTNSKEVIEYSDDVSEQVRALYEKIVMNLEEYFQGKTKITDINNKLRIYYNTIKNYCIHTGVINDSNEAYKSRILKDIYRNYRYNAVMVAVNVNDIEGRNLAKKIYNKDSDKESACVYYNSYYCYESEKLRFNLINMVKLLAAEENISSFDTESIDKRKRYVYDYGFNHAWLWNNKINNENRVEINKNLEPPKDMKIFYKENIDSLKEGKLIINCEDENFELNVRMNCSEHEGCNLLEILQSNNLPMTNNLKLKEFLECFYINS